MSNIEVINYSLAMSRRRILCATRDTQFCLAIQIQHNEQSGTKGRTKRRETYCKCTNSPAHVANLARGFRSPEHHHEESRRAQYTGRHSTASTSPSRVGVLRKDTIEKRGEGRRGRRKEGEGGEGRKEEEAKGAQKVEEPEASSDPRLPRRTLATPFLLPPAHSSSRYSTRPLKALFVPPAILRPSPFSLLSFPLSFLRPCFSHFVTLYFTPYLDFMRTTKWGYLLRQQQMCTQ